MIKINSSIKNYKGSLFYIGKIKQNYMFNKNLDILESNPILYNL